MSVPHCDKHSKFIPNCKVCKEIRYNEKSQKKLTKSFTRLGKVDSRSKTIGIDFEIMYRNMLEDGYDFKTQINAPSFDMYFLFIKRK